ncbi:hypothetical protein HMPREF1545_01857 [Oscillibacter sp. KLE 1728]|nr:hypothetical protein HMPREF1545_01857 [Oscillibacter sp. KLE 1728]
MSLQSVSSFLTVKISVYAINHTMVSAHCQHSLVCRVLLWQTYCPRRKQDSLKGSGISTCNAHRC